MSVLLPKRRLGMVLLTIASIMISTTKADIICTQFGAGTFHTGSTLTFQWNDTQSIAINDFLLNFYCLENKQLVQTVAQLNTATSISPTAWIVPASLTANQANCPSNQYFGAFDWNTTDPNTGLTVTAEGPCKAMLFIASTATVPTTTQTDDAGPGATYGPDGQIVVPDDTKKILIGVGCALAALVLAGVVGFYIIRSKNHKAAEKEAARKLREPIPTGPLFPPSNHGSRPSTPSQLQQAGGNQTRRYNQLASVTSMSTGSNDRDSYQSTGQPSRSEMIEMKSSAMPAVGSTVSSRSSSPVMDRNQLGSRSPTPIAAMNARILASAASNNGNLPPRSGSPSPLSQSSLVPGAGSPSSLSNGQRPFSLLTSPYTPRDDDDDTYPPAATSSAFPIVPSPLTSSSRNNRADEHHQAIQEQYSRQVQDFLAQDNNQSSYGSHPAGY